MLVSPRKNGGGWGCQGIGPSRITQLIPREVSGVANEQIKHTKTSIIKNFGPPKTPPPKFFMLGLFPVF